MYSYHELKKPIMAYLADFPAIIIGVLGDTRFLLIDSDGRYRDVPFAEVTADFRFDIDKKEWVDVDLFEPDG